MGRAEERRARQRGGRRAAPKRRRSSGAGGKSGIRRLFTWKKILGTFFGLCLLGMGAFIVLYMVIDIPEGNADAELQSNVYKYSDGTIMARDGERNREIVDLARIPKDVQRTFVAAENKTFYKDAGVDLKGTARGVLNTLSGKGAQGGSTITQQYVKNYYLSQEQTVSRKLKELVISLKLDREKSKDYILAGYINTSYYGRGAYGIQAAAQAYYRVDAEDLSVEQGAYLAALLQAPNQYDWAIASDTGKKLVQQRWNYVLDNMVEQKWLDGAARRGMTFPEPEAPKPAPGMEGQTGYLVEAANYALKERLVAQGAAEDMEQAKALVDLGGYTITLNIDRKKQAALEKSVKAELTSKLDPEKRDVDADVQAGAVSVDPKTGGVLAMYGGVDYVKHFTNNATRDDYQPASTFKPLILAAAVDQDAETQDGVPITANTLYDGTSRRPVMDGDQKVGFAPPNEDDVDYGDITVQEAMNKSVNSVFAQMGIDVGMPQVVKVAGDLGMETEGMEAVPAQTLGSMGASPLEMAGVYATLDNHGKKVTPAVVKSVEHKDRTVEFPEAIGEQVISREAADTVTSVLTGVVDDGTAKRSVRDNPLRDGQQVAGKTGTSDNNKSAWFTGFTPGLVTSVGLFGEDPKTHKQVPMYKAGGVDHRVNGGGFPAEIWAAYTFGVMDEVTEFDLETKQGAAVKPSTSPTVTQSPTRSPTPEETTEESPSDEPTTQEPTSQEPTTEEPSQSPSQSPSGTPSTEPPTGGTSTEPEDPLFPDGDRQER
ncbi:Bifunctional penicillin-binding protein 1a/1b pona1 [Streptomyces ambofaciens ATCC 23877]|uniref:Bifunctional penicillin-binding protein 1a/1b pona1 n=1 Tax=Streptomyces ambofaciens (strain ATCC 23877 / 3486 / DSM 40053 / JCM 4204 / NBRC 12836 / NRRL B-2516) TaxID=278992 RepID=A0A0K2AY99_STRA7|nr:transglycosylase domain-containing protein [Streptomyces ambofaciens]AKZ57886.1 Bifunctional penicillin-binding protein 1a/1b pona1 [Streptomyces ambofaciens ATCC 23877]